MGCGPSQDLMSTVRSSEKGEEGYLKMPVWRRREEDAVVSTWGKRQVRPEQ